ncbi:hypothetical protein IJJ36_04445 [Candidatus Saccharibacteria bacterium]|nr:hypothetical protein [Candidatus Saccharibacteria bacterium]
MTKGSRNLIILGTVSVMIALTTTGISLAWYHNSGDIYLDRSRPGYLPDEEEIKQDDDGEEDYEFPKSGTINRDILNEYANRLEEEIKALDDYVGPFDAAALSDERFGI